MGASDPDGRGSDGSALHLATEITEKTLHDLKMSPDEVIERLLGSSGIPEPELARHAFQLMQGPLTQSVTETYAAYLARLRHYLDEIRSAMAALEGFEGEASDTVMRFAQQKLSARFDQVRAVIDGRTRSREVASR